MYIDTAPKLMRRYYCGTGYFLQTRNKHLPTYLNEVRYSTYLSARNLFSQVAILEKIIEPKMIAPPRE